jgi:lipopolysaccharide transport system permease protein
MQQSVTTTPADLWLGFVNWRAWLGLAIDDLATRYARTVIGPFWVTLSHAVFVLGYAWWSSLVLTANFSEQIIYLAAGLTVWLMIANCLSDSCALYERAVPILMAYDLPVSMHVHRSVMGHFFSFGHNLLVFFAVIAVFGNPMNINTLLVIPALVVLYIAMTGIALGLGVFGRRYRDVGPLISSIVGALFILTPIFWRRGAVGAQSHLADLNPLYHLVEIVRAPMLGLVPSHTNWIVAIGFSLICLIVGGLTFANYRKQLSYWI